MKAYVFQAALLCEQCAQAVKESIARKALFKVPVNPDDESSYDSDDYPKGPYPNGGGEADCPQHCDHCGVFLENPLTSDGADYVRTAVAAANIGDTDRDTSWAEIADRADDLGRLAFAEWIRFYLAPGM